MDANLRFPRVMRILAVIALFAAKAIAAVMLLLLVVGYIFFLTSHDLPTHLYFAVTAVALISALAASPFKAWSKMRLILHAVIFLLAASVGAMEIHAHLNFFEGPNFGAAGMSGLSIAAVFLGPACSYYLSKLEATRNDV